MNDKTRIGLLAKPIIHITMGLNVPMSRMGKGKMKETLSKASKVGILMENPENEKNGYQ